MSPMTSQSSNVSHKLQRRLCDAEFEGTERRGTIRAVEGQMTEIPLQPAYGSSSLTSHTSLYVNNMYVDYT